MQLLIMHTVMTSDIEVALAICIISAVGCVVELGIIGYLIYLLVKGIKLYDEKVREKS